MYLTQYFIKITFITIFFCFCFTLQGQINRFTKIDKGNKKYEVPTSNGFTPCVNKKVKKQWVVYSDRNGNQSYKDSYAQYPNRKINFLQSCFVIDEKNDFLELVEYDEKLIPPRKSKFISFFKGKERFRFADYKQAKYIGWIHKSKLLMNTNAWAAEKNLKPLRFILNIGVSEVLTERDDFLRHDTIITFSDPGLLEERIPEEKIPLLNDIVYVYKMDKYAKKYLLGYSPFFAENSKDAMIGWVDKRVALNIGQQQVFRPRNEGGVSSFFKKDSLAKARISNEMDDSTYWSEKRLKSIDEEFYFNLELQEENNNAENQEIISTILNTEIWDERPNTVLNMLSEDITLNNYKLLKKESKKINIIIAYDKSADLKVNLKLLLNSIQKIYYVVGKDEFKEYELSYTAICYDNNRILEEFLFGKNLIECLDFIKGTLKGDYASVSLTGAKNGMKKSLMRASEILNGKSKQSNIVIVAGGQSSIMDESSMTNLSASLGNNSVRLFFWQMKNENEEPYGDFVLTAKALLYETGKIYAENKKNYIVDSELYRKKNIFRLIDEKSNIYMFDFPKNSAYQGGIASPMKGRELHPNLFDDLIDGLLLEIVEDNAAILENLDLYFEGIGRERNITHNDLKFNLKDRDIENDEINDLPISTYNDDFFLDFYAIEDSLNHTLDHYFLLSSIEYNSYMNNIKRLAPVIPEKIKRRFRRKLYKSYKKYYKKLSVNHCIDDKACETSIAKLLFLANGMAVNNENYKNIPLWFLKKKKLMTNEELINYLIKLRSFATQLEEYPNVNPHESLKIKGEEYMYIPAELFP